MKFKKTISTMFLFGTVVLGGLNVAQAFEDTTRVNAIAQAKANAKAEINGRRIANHCQEILAEVPGVNGGADCEEKRSQCETQIREDFFGDIQERIEACDPSVNPDDCFPCLAGSTQPECPELCEDNSTPTSRCLEEIDFRRRLAIAVAKYKARLRIVCRAEAPVTPPADPVVDGAQDQNPNQGVDAPAVEPVVNPQGAGNAAGGCSVNGMSGGMGSLSTFLLGLLPLTVAWIRKRK